MSTPFPPVRRDNWGGGGDVYRVDVCPECASNSVQLMMNSLLARRPLWGRPHPSFLELWKPLGRHRMDASGTLRITASRHTNISQPNKILFTILPAWMDYLSWRRWGHSQSKQTACWLSACSSGSSLTRKHLGATNTSHWYQTWNAGEHQLLPFCLQLVARKQSGGGTGPVKWVDIQSDPQSSPFTLITNH